MNVLGMAEKDELLDPDDDSPSDARPRKAATGSESGAPLPPERRLERDVIDDERERSKGVGRDAIGRTEPSGGTHDVCALGGRRQ